jgi:molybdopterin-guanine dinucleotide biosynthesis protein A
MSVRYIVDQPFGLILACGQARRLGGAPKLLLRLGDGTVRDEIAARLAPQVQVLAVNGDPVRLGPIEPPIIPDILRGLGPLSGIHAGLTWLTESGGQWLVTVAGDTPFIPNDLAPCLLDAAINSSAPAAIATDERGAHPTCAIWHVSLIADVEQTLARRDLKLMDFGGRIGAAKVAFPGADSFFNINTPEDLQQANAMISR